MNDLSRTMPSYLLRQRSACSLVKSELLGDKHRPRQHQATQVVEEMTLRGLFRSTDGGPINERTWKRWWNCENQIRPGNAELLDRVLTGQPGFIKSLLRGKEFPHQLHQLHQHFDAIDAAGWWNGETESDWIEQREDRCHRILIQLHRSWRLGRHGSTKLFPEPRAKLLYDRASPSERAEMEERWSSGFGKVMISYWLTEPDRLPDEIQEHYEILSPSSMPNFLFEVGKATDFLTDEKITLWSIHFATASLLHWGLMYCHRYPFMAGQHLEHLGLWDKVSTLFWGTPGDSEFLAHRLGILEQPQHWDALNNYRMARIIYRKTLRHLGISPKEVNDVFCSVYRHWPIKYKG